MKTSEDSRISVCFLTSRFVVNGPKGAENALLDAKTSESASNGKLSKDNDELLSQRVYVTVFGLDQPVKSNHRTCSSGDFPSSPIIRFDSIVSERERAITNKIVLYRHCLFQPYPTGCRSIVIKQGNALLCP